MRYDNREILEIMRYSNNKVSFLQNKLSSRESIKSIDKRDDQAKKADREIVVFTGNE
ncbi:MAG: hypothetical protein LC664_06085 [Flavobacteriales bacterium]|nr:hypothetical protein [Flavobacteriales bacterium]